MRKDSKVPIVVVLGLMIGHEFGYEKFTDKHQEIQFCSRYIEKEFQQGFMNMATMVRMTRLLCLINSEPDMIKNTLSTIFMNTGQKGLDLIAQLITLMGTKPKWRAARERWGMEKEHGGSANPLDWKFENRQDVEILVEVAKSFSGGSTTFSSSSFSSSSSSYDSNQYARSGGGFGTSYSGSEGQAYFSNSQSYGGQSAPYRYQSNQAFGRSGSPNPFTQSSSMNSLPSAGRPAQGRSHGGSHGGGQGGGYGVIEGNRDRGRVRSQSPSITQTIRFLTLRDHK